MQTGFVDSFAAVAVCQMDVAIIEHDGREYLLDKLLMHVPSSVLREIHAAGAVSGEHAWDEITRRWPDTARELLSRC